VLVVVVATTTATTTTVVALVAGRGSWGEAGRKARLIN